jgi:hypothetical protein
MCVHTGEGGIPKPVEGVLYKIEDNAKQCVDYTAWGHRYIVNIAQYKNRITRRKFVFSKRGKQTQPVSYHV